jgi:hypothetical protein
MRKVIRRPGLLPIPRTFQPTLAGKKSHCGNKVTADGHPSCHKKERRPGSEGTGPPLA